MDSTDSSSAAARVAAVPELMEMILLSTPLHDPRRMSEVCSWSRASRALLLQMALSVQLRHRLFLLDARPRHAAALSSSFRFPGDDDGLCPHDIPPAAESSPPNRPAWLHGHDSRL